MHNNKQNKTLLEHYYLFSLQKNKRTKKNLTLLFVFGKSNEQKISSDSETGLLIHRSDRREKTNPRNMDSELKAQNLFPQQGEDCFQTSQVGWATTAL